MLKFLKSYDLSGYRMIIPSVSVGNVGQLTVDLLLSTLKLSKIGYIWHRNIIPVAVKTDNADNVATACELFISEELKIVIVQIRSTFGPFARISAIFKELCSLVKCVIIITGSFAFERRDIQLVEDSIRYLSSKEFSAEGDIPIPPTLRKFREQEESNFPLRIPGSGIADHLYKLCVEEKIAVLLLLEFVSEGDNRIDAEIMANCLDSLLSLRKRSGLDERRWTPPLVWDSLYGNSFPQGIF